MTSLLFLSAAMRESKDETASYKGFKIPGSSDPKEGRNWCTALERGHQSGAARPACGFDFIVCRREDDPCKCRVASPKA